MSTLPSRLAYVSFVSVADMMGLVHHVGIEKMLTNLATEIEADFLRWQAFDKTPRVALHSAIGVIELMPTSDGETYGFKYVNGHPKNTAEGLQTVTAFGVLADVVTGYPKLLSEMTILTAVRTAATSAMVARHLAPEGARTMAMIGNGALCPQSGGQRPDGGVMPVRARGHRRRQIITTCTADKQYATS